METFVVFDRNKFRRNLGFKGDETSFYVHHIRDTQDIIRPMYKKVENLKEIDILPYLKQFQVFVDQEANTYIFVDPKYLKEKLDIIVLKSEPEIDVSIKGLDFEFLKDFKDKDVLPKRFKLKDNNYDKLDKVYHIINNLYFLSDNSGIKYLGILTR